MRFLIIWQFMIIGADAVCSCTQKDVGQQIRGSDLVIKAKILTQTTPAPPTLDPQGRARLVYTITVKKVYRNKNGGPVPTLVGSSDFECGRTFVPDNDYVIFGYDVIGNGTIMITGVCVPTGKFDLFNQTFIAKLERAEYWS